MSRKEKLIERFKNKPNDFTYDEMVKLLTFFDYYEKKTGKTSGSRVAFLNIKNKHIIRLHKPHPGNILKKYQINLVETELKNKGIL